MTVSTAFPRAPESVVEAYEPDALSWASAALRTLLACVGGAVLSFAAWFVLHTTSLPAFNTSMVTRGLATLGSVLVVCAAAVACLLWLRRPWGWFARRVLAFVCTMAPAGLVVSSLGLPLASTRLWLDGIQVDQGFRTQFLTRMAETAANQDMNYFGLPTFYPLGWFWLGGRTANLLDMAGWEVYQPWAIMSLAAASAALVPVWRKLSGSLPAATAIALVSTAVVLTETPDEPYAAIVALFVPAAAVTAVHALSGSWWASVLLALYLGISATFYTLFTALAALTVVILAVVMFVRTRYDKTPVVHLFVTGVLALCIAAVAWGPYFYYLFSGEYEVRSTANHFLPIEGTLFPLPFFSFSAIGVLCLLGVLWLLWRMKEAEGVSLGTALLVCYGWILASMGAAILGTSLLGFRVEVLVILVLATAGVLALVEVRTIGVDMYYPDGMGPRSRKLVTVALTVLLSGAVLLYAQQIPAENEAHIDRAYADTDGAGERADRYPADAGRYYGEVTEFIQQQGHVPTETVIYTDEINFMAYNPYYGFNAYTSHYANPLGEFHLRNDELSTWSKLSFERPEELTEAIAASQWEPPKAFIFRGVLEREGEPWKTHISHDIFPSQPNVRYEGLFFNPEAFPEREWAVKQIGPFVVVVLR